MVNSNENLGEILRGDRIESSLYELSMKHDEYCKLLCPAIVFLVKNMPSSFMLSVGPGGCVGVEPSFWMVKFVAWVDERLLLDGVAAA